MFKRKLKPVRDPRRSRWLAKGKVSNGLKARASTELSRMSWFWLARWICRVFCILFFRLRVYGKENIPEKGAFILVSNHQSYLDPIFCGAPVKRHLYFLARDTLFANWLFGQLLSSVNTIPVRRAQPLGGAGPAPRRGGAGSAMRKVISKLKEGRGICLFPEGTRTSDGKITPFKPGFGLLARRGEAAVVPTVIDGAFECWPRHKKIFSFGGRIIVSYGKAITAKQVKNMNDRELAKVLTDTLCRMQNDCRVKHGKKPYNY